MQPHMAEMGYDAFMEEFMPANGIDLPGQSRSYRSSARIPNMSRENLMGSEAKVCEELVRLVYPWILQCIFTS